MGITFLHHLLDPQNDGARKPAPASRNRLLFSTLAAAAGLCCQFWTAPASASEGTCPGVDGRDIAALETCVVHQICIEGIYDPPRSVALDTAAMAAYRAAEMDVTERHYKLEVRFRKRADASTGQCGYQSAERFMFSIVEQTAPSVLKVSFDPDWVY